METTTETVSRLPLREGSPARIVRKVIRSSSLIRVSSTVNTADIRKILSSSIVSTADIRDSRGSSVSNTVSTAAISSNSRITAKTDRSPDIPETAAVQTAAATIRTHRAEPLPPTAEVTPQNDGGGYSNQPRRQQPAKNSRKHKSILGKVIRRIIFSLLTLFLLLFGIYSCTALSLIKKVNKEETDTRYHTAGAMEESYVHSVLIIGTDGRTLDDRGRSDTMILLSLNTKTDELIMTSFMRDCYVDIPNNGWDKLNAAYVYGGPSLLMDTIEKNFNVRIDDYVTINFNSFASIIDAVGGVDIDVSDEEASAVNDVLISEVNELMGDDRMDDLLTSGGKLHLNGKQALSYARIRYVNGGNDFERTQRQRTIVNAVINKAKSFKPSMLSDVASNVIPQVSTNMSTFDMYVYSIRLPFAVRYDTKQVRIPAENTYSYGSAYLYGAEQSVLEVDFAANEQIIQDEVFSDKK